MKCYMFVHKLALLQLSMDNPIYMTAFVFRILQPCMTDITLKLLIKMLLLSFSLYCHAYWLRLCAFNVKLSGFWSYVELLQIINVFPRKSIICYWTDYQTGHFRILTSHDHSGIQVDFCCSGFYITKYFSYCRYRNHIPTRIPVNESERPLPKMNTIFFTYRA